jgi:hypothetical protein
MPPSTPISWGACPPTSSPSSSKRCQMALTWPISIRLTTNARSAASTSWCVSSSTPLMIYTGQATGSGVAW